MADTYTGNYNLVKIEQGTTGWADKANGNMDTIDMELNSVSSRIDALGLGIGYVNVKDYGAKGDGTTDDTNSVLAAIAAGSGKTIYFPPGNYKTTSQLTLSSANTRICGAGKFQTTISWTGGGTSYSVGAGTIYGQTGTAAIVITSSSCAISDLTVKGPVSGSYSAGQRLIVVSGADSSNMNNGFILSNCILRDSGSAGVILIFCEKFRISGNEIYNIGYEAVQMISCRKLLVDSNYVHDVTPGSSGNMYGISLSHDSALWPGDQTTSPFTDDAIVVNNRVENIAWEGISNHGGQRHTVIGNQIYNVGGCLSFGASSGGASAYSGGDHVIVGNDCDSGPSYAHTGHCSFQGGSSQYLTNVRIMGNSFRRLGLPDSATGGAVRLVYTSRINVSENMIREWRGHAIYVTNSSAININGNQISKLAAADAYGYAITTDSDISELFICGNHVITGGGTIAARGISLYSSATSLVSCRSNFITATLPISGTILSNYDGPPTVVITSGASTYDVSTYGSDMTIVFNLGAPQTVTNFTNPFQGQKLTLVNITANNLTFTRANAYLPGGIDSVLGQYDAIGLVYYGTTWKATTPIVTNS